MYKSPIEIIHGQMQTQMEGDILRVVQSYGINVDKEELIRALQYDRDQYEKGYADGKSDAVVHGQWLDGGAVRNGKKVYDSIDCSVCEEIFKIESHDREYWKNRFKVCPFCGAKMDGGD